VTVCTSEVCTADAVELLPGVTTPRQIQVSQQPWFASRLSAWNAQRTEPCATAVHIRSSCRSRGRCIATLSCLMFVFRESPIFATVAVSSPGYGVTVVVLEATAAKGSITYCSRGILLGKQCGVSARKLRRERDDCVHTGTRPARRTERIVTQHALSPP
jgi:hypothetical protein